MMKIQINDAFWSPKRDINRREALLYQWDQYCRCGTIENFRLVADHKQGTRQGFFYTDSDLHKWADAVSRVLISGPDQNLEGLLNDYIDLMERAQEADGYLYTWNQIYFPEVRWSNIQVEHELYTAGHFIEAGVSHYQATGIKTLYNLALKTADLIVRDFKKISPAKTPGHQEIEIALLKLYRLSGNRDYLTTAESFLFKRGLSKVIGFHLLRDVLSHMYRNRQVRKKGVSKKNEMGFEFGENIQSREPRFIMARSFLSFLDGSYLQQHKGLLKQVEAKGHSVRWAYMMYAAAILAKEENLKDVENFLRECWENLITKKMYISGGIGSLPVIEGFGRDYELDNEFSYSETCAAIASIFWNNEMLQYSPRAEYADLVERQLYNAASVGISQDGKKYFYRNPLESCGELERQSWFETACCPSNISRLWADVQNLIYSSTDNALYINQYIGSQLEDEKISLRMISQFPWEGRVSLKLKNLERMTIHLRIPGWADHWNIQYNNENPQNSQRKPESPLYTDVMKQAHYHSIDLPPGENSIELDFPMHIKRNTSDHRVKGNRGKIALSRGPLIYCIESESEIADSLDISNLHFVMDGDSFQDRSGKLVNDDLTLIPYYLWGNRGKRKMKVWFKALNEI